MAYHAKVFKIMIASPGDVQVERNVIREVVHEWNSIHAEKNRIVLLPVGWETDGTPIMGEHPQEILNSQILRSSDVLVAVFWTRIGTATPLAASGTVEEIQKHVAAGKPAMLYFSGAPVRIDSVDETQYQELNKFKAKCRDQGLVETYETTTEFRDKFTRQLAALVNTHALFARNRNAGTGVIDEVSVSTPVETPDISKEARVLLVEAAQDSTGTVMKLAYIGGFTVQTNKKQFVEPGNPRSRAAWEGAISELVRYGLLEARGYKGEVFGVTRRGYELADMLKQ